MIQKVLNKYKIESFFVISLMILPFLPTWGSLDKIGQQYLFLSFLQICNSFYLYKVSNKSDFKLTILECSLFGTLFISLASFFASDFLLQSWIEFMRLAIYVMVFFNLTFTLKRVKNIDKLLLAVLLFFLTSEVIAVLVDFLKIYEFDNPFGRSRLVEGLSSNLNVGAFSILIKVPLIIYFLNKTKSFFYKLLLYIILAFSFFSIFIMSSRGAMIGLIVFSVLFISFSIFQYFRKNSLLDLFIYLFILGITFLSHSYLFQNRTDFRVTSRLVSFQGDNSTNYRLGYYKDAVDAILNHPILGMGIGTWKVNSIRFIGEKMQEYEVPYHVHNDFLQLGAETGIIGMFFYLSIFLIPLVIILRRLLKSKPNQDVFLDFLLISALIIFTIDSCINFPKARPYTMINILFYLAIINHYYFSSFNPKLKISLKNLQLIFILLLIPINFHNYKIFQNLKDQMFLFLDYNINKDFSRPLTEIEGFETQYDNLSVSAFPIYNELANYYIFQGKQDKAIELARKGRKANPFLYASENQIGQAYYFKNNIDSAYYYSKLAFEKRPFNSAHVTHFQKILYAKKAPLEEYNQIIETIKDSKIYYESVTFWVNHLQAIVYTKNYSNFTENDKEIANEAVKLFPKNKTIKAFNKLIVFGIGVLDYSNRVDLDAKKLFEEGQYKEAIKLWEKSIEVLPTEDAYYLNIAQAHFSMNNSDMALKYLKIVEQLDIKEEDGKFEFLLGLYFFDKGDIKKACEAMRFAYNSGYKEALNIYKSINCN